MSRNPVRFTFDLPSFLLTRQSSANKSLIDDHPPTPINQPINPSSYCPNHRINIGQSTNQSTNQSINQSTLSQRTPRARSANTSPILGGRVTSANQSINQSINTPMGGRLSSANQLARQSSNQSINQAMSMLPPMIRTSSASMSSPNQGSSTPANQSINQPTTPSTNQSTNQSCFSRVRSRLSTSHRSTAAMISIYSRPWLQSRSTLLVLTFMFVVFNLISLYFTAFGLYLTHFLHTNAQISQPTQSNPFHILEIPNQCATKELTAFLLFVMIRSVIEICLLAWRAIDRTLWINHWPSLKPYQKAFLCIRSFLSLSTIIFIGLSCSWLIDVSSDMSGEFQLGNLDCVQLAYEVVVGLTAYEIAGLVTPALFMLPLSCFFSWKTISYFPPFLPLSPEMFEKPIAGLTNDELKQLPQTTYDLQKHGADKCSICLGEFVANQDIRVLPCHHVFDVQCIDEWLQTKRTCPLCVQVVEPVSNRRRFSFAISRTRRNDSQTRSRQSTNNHSDDEDEHSINQSFNDEHDFGLRHHSPEHGSSLAIEMIDQSTHSQ